jgi:hypothetical protein
VTVRRTILIEEYGWPVDVPDDDAKWCAREYVQHGDESRTTRVLHTAPTRAEVADWLAARYWEAGTPRWDSAEFARNAEAVRRATGDGT